MSIFLSILSGTTTLGVIGFFIAYILLNKKLLKEKDKSENLFVRLNEFSVVNSTQADTIKKLEANNIQLAGRLTTEMQVRKKMEQERAEFIKKWASEADPTDLANKFNELLQGLSKTTNPGTDNR